MTHPKVKVEWDDGNFDASKNNIVFHDTTTPCVTVCIMTHNRTNVACATIDYLVKNLRYDNLKWCISDDRSTEKNHLEKLV
jgi:hypothetical protein